MKIIRYYFYFSSILFLTTFLKVCKGPNMVLSIWLGIGLIKKNYLITFNFITCLAIALLSKIKNTLIGSETESMKHIIAEHLYDLFTYLFLFFFVDYQSLFPCLIFAIIYYFAHLFLAKISSFFNMSKHPPKQIHYYLDHNYL